ncbi:PEP-CTERM sorting domain-containing protein [Endozoicomonas sp. G2_1]|uniref:PEP-CTERM sorting domain-containing protein n=1 Tax=Endozoicomonas sp. G2_1 TaxID=2821091 RepID=UPI001AD9664C|nr:PEP-CTERM sorting domain-containing protein [Endozoicomonas sp. G2_1]MBO9490997.1 PEP-CTERM sorting domain-containing protein [Endozoicomonas sp. G2_1]
MKAKNLLIPFLFAPAISMATPIPVDLSGWTAEEGNGSPAASWNVQGIGNDSVFQSQNSRPSIFFNPGSNDQGQALSGQITVETGADDDFIGFVLGYNTGEFNSANADFWLIDWKQANQGSANVGLALSHITGDVSTAPELNFWEHNGVVNEVQRATNLGSTGWIDFQTYDFELVFTSTLIEVQVDGVKELSFAGNFTNGSFGFYNYSQGSVRYAGITQADAPPPSTSIPEPSSLLILLTGILAILVRQYQQQ